jgi:MFS family permease
MGTADERRSTPMTPRPSELRIALAGMMSVAVAMGIGRFAFTPLLPMMQDDAGLTVSRGGWLASANYLGYFLGALIAMGARVQAATAIRSGLIAIAVSTAAMAFHDRFEVWLVLRAVAGIANAWVAVYAFSWCLEQLPASRPLLRGLVFSGVGAGIAGAGLMCLLLMQSGSGSDRAWLVLGVLALVLTVEPWPVYAADRRKTPRDASALTPEPPFWDSNSVGLVIGFGTAGFGYITSATFLPAMARQIIPDPALFGWAWPVFGLAAMASTLAAAALSGLFANRSVWTGSQLVMAAGVALPAFIPGLGAILMSALCVGGTFMVITMASMQEARAAGGRHPTVLIAALTASFALGQIIGPIVSTWIAGPDGRFSSALLLASFVLIAGTRALTFRNAAERQRTPSQFT